MLDGNLITIHDSCIPSADARWPAPSISVGYLEPEALHAPRARDTLDILVPTGSANLFASFRDDHGQQRTALVHAPLISVVRPGLPHALADQSRARTLVLGISRSVFAEAALAAHDGALPSLREPHAASDPLLRHIGDSLEADVRGQRPLDARYLESMAAVLAMHVARHYAVTVAASGATGGLAPHKLQQVRDFIDCHLAEAITVEQLARVAHLSPFHFARMFKQSTGQSPHLHILMQRMARARQLLTGTDLALVEVAAEVGFRTQGHFTGVFHRYSGCTPRTFRLDARAATANDPQSAGTGAPRFRPAARRP